jgi:allophanate hydrolase
VSADGPDRPTVDSVDRVLAAYATDTAAKRPEVWITLRDEGEVLAEAAAIDARVAAGEDLPLAGRTFAVKDNIDAAGLPTTAACPAFSYVPEADSPAVARLKEAGAILLGKTNLDQFATGLVGTRSPYGAVRDSRRPDHVSGGSSSGSAVVVALGVADIALGTDTAGSGRVPAAFQGIVGVKPTRGLVPTTGVVPACRSLDCVSIFASDLALAEEALSVIAGPDPTDALSRVAPADAPPAAVPAAGAPTDVPSAPTIAGGGAEGTSDGPRVGSPSPDSLGQLTDEARAAFAAARDRLAAAGAQVIEIDIAPLLDAGALLYGGAFVAERHAAVGAFVESHAEEVDPTVREIVMAAAAPSASQLFTDQERLDRLALATRRLFADLDAILLPTTAAQPTIAAVEADPIAENARLGAFTNCANLLDLCAVAVPAGEADGGRFGVQIYAPAFHDAVAAGVAALVADDSAATPADPLSFVTQRVTKDRGSMIELFVAGAHLSGMPLNPQLTERGARLLGEARTAPRYRLYALDTTPPKPGVVRVDSEGASLPGELWGLSPAALGTFLAQVPRPMALGEVELEDGRSVVGFLCEPIALEGAEDITATGGWRAYLGGG